MLSRDSAGKGIVSASHRERGKGSSSPSGASVAICNGFGRPLGYCFSPNHVYVEARYAHITTIPGRKIPYGHPLVVMLKVL
jgi:hypothetical protein